MNKYMLLAEYDENELEIVLVGDKKTIREAFEDHITQAEASSYYMVKVVIEAHPSFEISEHSDDDENDL